MGAYPVKDTNFNMRMNTQKKAELEALYASLGMTLPEAVNVFFENSLLVGGLPFSLRVPHYTRSRAEEPDEDSPIEMSDDEKIDFVAARILREHKKAFLELAK